MSRAPKDQQPKRRASLSTSRSLLVRVRNDEDDAWTRLVDLYTPLVCYWCRQNGLSEQDLPDVAQEIFQAVARNIERFRDDGPKSTFRGWLRTVTRSKVADSFRRKGKEPDAAGGPIHSVEKAKSPTRPVAPMLSSVSTSSLIRNLSLARKLKTQQVCPRNAEFSFGRPWN